MVYFNLESFILLVDSGYLEMINILYKFCGEFRVFYRPMFI